MTRPKPIQDQDIPAPTDEVEVREADALSGGAACRGVTVVIHPRAHRFLVRLTRSNPEERLFGPLYGQVWGEELHVEVAVPSLSTRRVYWEATYAQGWHAGWDAAMHQVMGLEQVGNWTLLGARCDPLATYEQIGGDPEDVASLYVDEVRLFAEVYGKSHLERTLRYLAYLIAPAGEVTAQVPVVRASRFFPSPQSHASEAV